MIEKQEITFIQKMKEYPAQEVPITSRANHQKSIAGKFLDELVLCKLLLAVLYNLIVHFVSFDFDAI